ncbi:hypothetical protein [Noviherbaspirillum malthae]|uniref:hypothetical protein n=1 Tax=Noviherbaspirillum malthae TaxID=1260987 RepID=UPI00188F2A64|nr:hypothetical protein [Noviherbaspirillum malthae]
MIVRRELYEAAIKIGAEAVYDPDNVEHQMLLSSGLALLNPLPPPLQTADSSRRLLLLTPKGELVIQSASD